jgi:hypothetical protein
MYGTRPAIGCLPAETLGVVGHEPPVIGRFSQHPLGFGVYGFVGQSIAFCRLGAKFFSSSHNSSIPPGKDAMTAYQPITNISRRTRRFPLRNAASERHTGPFQG